MVRDAYANYVVQTAIDVVPEGNEKRMMLDELKAHEVQLVSGMFFSNQFQATLPVHTHHLRTSLVAYNSEITLLLNTLSQSYPCLNTR